MLTRIAGLNEGLKQVSDNIAHDLKTPLTRLRNRAEAALAGDSAKAGYREALEATIAESDQLIKTFNAILMISRLEAGYSTEALDQGRSRGHHARRCRALRAGGRRTRRHPGGAGRWPFDDRRQPRTDRPGAFQHRRQRHQIFRGRQRQTGSPRVDRAIRRRSAAQSSPTTARASPTSTIASGPPNVSCGWSKAARSPARALVSALPRRS